MQMYTCPEHDADSQMSLADFFLGEGVSVH